MNEEPEGTSYKSNVTIHTDKQVRCLQGKCVDYLGLHNIKQICKIFNSIDDHVTVHEGEDGSVRVEGSPSDVQKFQEYLDYYFTNRRSTLVIADWVEPVATGALIYDLMNGLKIGNVRMKTKSLDKFYLDKSLFPFVVIRTLNELGSFLEQGMIQVVIGSSRQQVKLTGSGTGDIKDLLNKQTQEFSTLQLLETDVTRPMTVEDVQNWTEACEQRLNVLPYITLVMNNALTMAFTADVSINTDDWQGFVKFMTGSQESVSASKSRRKSRRNRNSTASDQRTELKGNVNASPERSYSNGSPGQPPPRALPTLDVDKIKSKSPSSPKTDEQRSSWESDDEDGTYIETDIVQVSHVIVKHIQLHHSADLTQICHDYHSSLAITKTKDGFQFTSKSATYLRNLKKTLNAIVKAIERDCCEIPIEHEILRCTDWKKVEDLAQVCSVTVFSTKGSAFGTNANLSRFQDMLSQAPSTTSTCASAVTKTGSNRSRRLKTSPSATTSTPSAGYTTTSTPQTTRASSIPCACFRHIGTGCKVYVIQGDITKIEVDTIVSAANETLHNGGGVARAIEVAAGTQYERDCKKYIRQNGRIRTTSVAVTRGANLPSQWVIHAVGPSADEYSQKHKLEEDLRSTFKNILHKANEMNLSSVAIPAISSGIYAVPLDLVTKCAIEMCLNHLNNTKPRMTSLKAIVLIDIQQTSIDLFQQKLMDHINDEEFEFLPGERFFTGSQNYPNIGRTTAVVAPMPVPSSHTSNGSAIGYSAIDAYRPHSPRFNEASSTATVSSSTSRSHTFGSTPSDCSICQDTVTNPKKLPCGHIFCTECIDQAFQYKPVCPECGATHGRLTGNQPEGTMDVQIDTRSVPGYEGYKTYVIDYNFPSGIQRLDHPNPGKPYYGTHRQAFLPANPEGGKVLRLLQEAFKAKLLFTIGMSRTTGKDDVVTWNDVHHKTSTNGGPAKFGYPDPTYLTRVQEELAAKGIVDKDEARGGARPKRPSSSYLAEQDPACTCKKKKNKSSLLTACTGKKSKHRDCPIHRPVTPSSKTPPHRDESLGTVPNPPSEYTPKNRDHRSVPEAHPPSEYNRKKFPNMTWKINNNARIAGFPKGTKVIEVSFAFKKKVVRADLPNTEDGQLVLSMWQKAFYDKILFKTGSDGKIEWNLKHPGKEKEQWIASTNTTYLGTVVKELQELSNQPPLRPRP